MATHEYLPIDLANEEEEEEEEEVCFSQARNAVRSASVVGIAAQNHVATHDEEVEDNPCVDSSCGAKPYTEAKERVQEDEPSQERREDLLALLTAAKLLDELEQQNDKEAAGALLELQEPPCALDRLLDQARLPLASDVPAPYNDMRKGIRALRDGSRLRLAIPATNTPDMCYFDALDAIKPPPEFFNDPTCYVSSNGDFVIGGVTCSEGTLEYSTLFATALSYIKASGWSSGRGALDTVYYRGKRGEAKKKGREFFLINNHEMIKVAVEQRADLFKAKLRSLG